MRERAAAWIPPRSLVWGIGWILLRSRQYRRTSFEQDVMMAPVVKPLSLRDQWNFHAMIIELQE